MSKIVCKAYTHASKERMFWIGQNLGLHGEALGMLKHAFAEVEIEFEVDTDTGEVRMLAASYGKETARVSEEENSSVKCEGCQPVQGMQSIPATEIQFNHRTIWVHSPRGGTVLRILCPDGIKAHKCQDSPISHSDLIVRGPVTICVSEDARRLRV